ncbi:hypothetical protein AKO1_015854 [Acrasis kona]|uniref:Uncharacterized protein n=1 Tax=Acrasis kona TaxID=1008807 RepID=A0AAW2ZHB4_9EUKA
MSDDTIMKANDVSGYVTLQEKLSWGVLFEGLLTKNNPSLDDIMTYEAVMEQPIINIKKYATNYFQNIYPNCSVIASDKVEGIRVGCTISIIQSDTEALLKRYFVKTHHNGYSTEGYYRTNTERCHENEIIVYKTLELLDILPELHYFGSMTMDEGGLYMATLDAAYESNYFVTKNNWKRTTEIKQNREVDDCILLMRMLDQIFSLRDGYENGANYGFVFKSGVRPALKVIDMMVESDFVVPNKEKIKSCILQEIAFVVHVEKSHKYTLPEVCSLVRKIIPGTVKFTNLLVRAKAYLEDVRRMWPQYVCKSSRLDDFIDAVLAWHDFFLHHDDSLD